MRQTLIAGNWKMKGSRATVRDLLQRIKSRVAEVRQCEWVVFPPFVFLQQVADICQDSPELGWGAQNVNQEPNGAFTGEISATMLKDFGCRYVIVGHSERRMLYHEDNGVVALKFVAAMSAGLRPVLCVGESLEQYESGHTLSILKDQLDAVLSLDDNHPVSALDWVLAYEPIWAIGTGRQATPEQAQEVHCALRAHCVAANPCFGQLRILYGGSVKPENATGLLAMPDVDGVLVGGASLDADKFIEIGLCSNSF